MSEFVVWLGAITIEQAQNFCVAIGNFVVGLSATTLGRVEQYSSIAGNFAIIAGLVGIIVIYHQYKHVIKSEIVKNTIELINQLQHEEVRSARFIVFSKLIGKKLNKYSLDERRLAGTVCSSYTIAGIFLKNRYIDEELITSSWGPSVIRTRLILEDYIVERRKTNGDLFWREFDDLAERCIKWREDHGLNRLTTDEEEVRH